MISHHFQIIFISGGYYVYLESSWPRKIGDKADLISSIMSPTEELGSSCFTFWYYMYGPRIGTLAVYTIIQNRLSLRWTRSGTQGDEWKLVQLTIISDYDYQVNSGFLDLIAIFWVLFIYSIVQIIYLFFDCTRWHYNRSLTTTLPYQPYSFLYL